MMKLKAMYDTLELPKMDSSWIMNHRPEKNNKKQHFHGCWEETRQVRIIFHTGYKQEKINIKNKQRGVQERTNRKLSWTKGKKTKVGGQKGGGEERREGGKMDLKWEMRLVDGWMDGLLTHRQSLKPGPSSNRGHSSHSATMSCCDWKRKKTKIFFKWFIL